MGAPLDRVMPLHHRFPLPARSRPLVVSSAGGAPELPVPEAGRALTAALRAASGLALALGSVGFLFLIGVGGADLER